MESFALHDSAVPAPGTADDARPAARWIVRAAWGRAALATSLFAALTIANTYPLAFRPGSLIGHHGDAYFSVWRLAWIAHQLRTDPLRLFEANIFYPEPATLAYSDAMLLPGTVVAPLAWLGVEPVAVYSLTLLAAFFLSGLAAYALVRRLTGSTVAGLLAGVIFAFSPHRFDHFDHLELQFAFWIPLAALAWHRATEGGRTRDYLLVGLSITGQVLSSIYHGVFLLTWIAVVSAVWFLRRPASALRPGVLMLAPPLLALALYSVPYLEVRDRVGERRAADIAALSAKPADFLSAPRSNVLYGWTSSIGTHERYLFPGLVAVGLVAIGLWPPFDRTRIAHLVGLLLALDLTLGFNGVLYRLLYEWVLPFRGLRVPARADILVLLGTAVFAGYGFARLRRRLTGRFAGAVLAAALLAGASVECFTRPGLKGVLRASPWYDALAAAPGTVIFEWPVTVPWRLWNMMDVEYMYRSTRHWQPLLNGYSGNYPESYIQLLLRMRSFPDKGSIEHLRRRGVTTIVLHERRGSRPSFDAALERLVTDPQIRLVAEDFEPTGRVVFLRFRHAPPLLQGSR
jgi:hypothetical protein